ncbi:Hsp20/alpha crystallin family protein [Alicyclobacillus acidoterrestris]|uniref:Hsp20/alpha crystallin family protein n=1 Tax=Alicyclobacillus acidoterrestris (strain ATCC 49025 / DSM 3922 / CIP 106132 / NCIMB 13137 / GD3B) TaxID=1356854 RepID=T0CU83_ALIAG|nr:Hsp20/alpha crystallin family protein [Alicyclobacillus acidoterrestris]EPZ41136.1 hypothetical protein N007_17365 [Alicyclobacillus acidoterrestris ATCC 49025]UNO47260.1 Hsp20/alpha crystallin family protein [Alicyclobacillus acidoterrestris]
MKNGGQQNPFEYLKNLGDLRDIKKLLGEDFFKHFSMAGFNADPLVREEETEQVYPAVDIYDLGNEFSVWAEIPGLKRTDISLQVSSYSLFLRGNVPTPTGKRNAHVLTSERYVGPFERTIELPVRIRPESVKASYANGLLIIILEKFSPTEGEIHHAVDIEFE